MWDQHELYGRALAVARIIPTYVGSTRLIGATTSLAPNHSHVCGINFKKIIDGCIFVESFPRMWDQPINSTIIN